MHSKSKNLVIMKTDRNHPAPPTMEEFRDYLKRHGMKATPQRMAVHEAMLKLGHASADMVAGTISENGREATVASVYNILSGLSEAGVYHRRLSSYNKMYFDVNSFNHIHLYDSANNSYTDFIDDELLDLVTEKLGKKRFKGYKVDYIDVQIVCHPSRKKAVKQ